VTRKGTPCLGHLKCLYGNPFIKDTSQFNAVEEDNSSIITAAGAIKIIIKDPLFSILEEDSNKTHSTG